MSYFSDVPSHFSGFYFDFCVHRKMNKENRKHFFLHRPNPVNRPDPRRRRGPPSATSPPHVAHRSDASLSPNPRRARALLAARAAASRHPRHDNGHRSTAHPPPHARWRGPPSPAPPATARTPLDGIAGAPRIPPGQPLPDKLVPTGAPCPTSLTLSPTPCRLYCPAAPRPLASPSGNDSTQRIARAWPPNDRPDHFTQHPYIEAMTYCPLPPLPTPFSRW
jgi:hypothetical protein